MIACGTSELSVMMTVIDGTALLSNMGYFVVLRYQNVDSTVKRGKCIDPHQFNECRFDVNVNDCTWYLRAANEDNRNRWINTIELHRVFCSTEPHQFNECRFDVNVNDCTWYLRAANEDNRNRWINTIELHRVFCSTE
ncbi:Hypothetical predicted protein, partial [Mytilus galloprovincialis]